ncbi:MAG: hypothetical protein ACTSW1_04080 [Candidatus Hodarchaeales archaeon]
MKWKLKFAILLLISLNSVVFTLTQHGEAKFNVSMESIYEDNRFENKTEIVSGIPQTGIFNTSSNSHNWFLKDIVQGHIIYFSVSPKTPLEVNNLKINVFNPEGEKSDFQETPGLANKFLGSWVSPITGDWIIQVNTTLDPNNQSYEILATIPESGYDENSAVEIFGEKAYGNYTQYHEVHYWKVRLSENQNGTLYLTEVTPNVLFHVELTIYPKLIGLQNPVLRESQISPIDGSYNFSWNARLSDDYIIKIQHKAQVGFPIGLYNISFSSMVSGFNFDTANQIPHNKTVYVNIDRGFVPRKRLYFWFQINASPSNVHINIFEVNFISNYVLDYATVEIYDEWGQNRIFNENEGETQKDGEINFTDSLNAGKYFLVILPQPNAVGVFGINFHVQLPRPFIWTPFAFLLSVIILIAFPSYLIYLDQKGKWFRVEQWTVSLPLPETYKYFKYSFSGLFNINEVPNDSILVRVASIPLRIFVLLHFIESSENETLVFSKRIRRKVEWVLYFLIALIVFDILNLGAFVTTSQHILPIYIPNLTTLLVTLIIPTILLIIIVLFINVSAYITYSQLVNRISYIIDNIPENEAVLNKSLDPTQASKNINYVRVLWNQAKHAFRENNFELFVIKADAAVKNLLSTRYLQIVSVNSYNKPDFQVQVAELRKRGFDLPNDKKIAHFRNLRNKIVHSSVTLGEKESVDCFAYYSTFITRLGLRPT